MNHLARDLTRAPITQETGVVTAVAGREFTVRTDDGEYTARRAASCMLQPELDDLVLLAVVPSRDGYVLAVLERAEGAASRVVVDGDLELQLAHGRLQVAAQEGVSVVTAGDLDLVAARLAASADAGSVTVGALSVLADLVRAEVARVRVEAGAIDTVAERVIERLQRSYRAVEELDHLRAGVIDHAARETLKLRGENAVVTAAELVKVDGEQIHLG